MQKFFRNVLYSGIQDRLNPEDQVRILFINSIIFFGLTVLAVFGIRDLFYGERVVGWVTMGVSAVIVAMFFLIRITKNIAIGAWFLPFLMFGFYTYLTVSGGNNATGVLWMLTYPVIAVFLIGSAWGGLFAVVFLTLQSMLFFVPQWSPVAAMDLEFKMRLIGVYIIVFSFSMAFEIIRRRAQAELAQAASDLEAEKIQTDGILTNVNEGIFLLDATLTIGDHHSRSLGGLLNLPEPAGANLVDVLKGRISEREVRATQDYLEMFFLPSPPWHLMEEINPLSEISLTSETGSQRLTFSFSAVELSTGRRVLGTVRDVTTAYVLGRKLKDEEDRSARQMRHLFQIIHVKPELLLQFLQDADEEIGAINRRLKDPRAEASGLVEDLFQGVHAVKGNAALVGLSAFTQRVHEFETKVATYRGTKPDWQAFLELTVGLSIIQAELAEIRELLGRMSTFQRGLEASAGGKDLLVLALEKAVEKMGQETGLKVDLDLERFEPDAVPERHRKLIKDILVQLVRNSFAHGLEAPGERQSLGKPPRPRIRVSAQTQGRSLALAYWDDGRGVDLERLRKATQGGRELSDDQTLELVFRAGISTSASATVHAGRGVGLGLVKDRVEAAGGRIRIRSVPRRGVAFDITLPMA